MTKSEMLKKIQSARMLLERHFVAGTRDDGRGGHCHLGCLEIAIYGSTSIARYRRYELPFPDICHTGIATILNVAAQRLYPMPSNSERDYRGNEAAYVNDELGKEAVLAVYDDVIAAFEVAVLYEEETAKHAARAGLQDAVEIERYAASLRVDSIGE